MCLHSVLELTTEDWYMRQEVQESCSIHLWCGSVNHIQFFERYSIQDGYFKVTIYYYILIFIYSR